MADIKINSNEVLFCPACLETFPEIKVRGKTPFHQIFDTLNKCSGTDIDLKVRVIRPDEVLKRTPLLLR